MAFDFSFIFYSYALIVGQLGSTFKDSNGGVSSWVQNTSTKRLAYYADGLIG